MVTITTKIGRQDVIYPEIFTTDGTAQHYMHGQTEITRNARWEGRTLVLDLRTKVNGVERGRRETLSLSEDGKVMTKTVHFFGPEPRFSDDQPVF